MRVRVAVWLYFVLSIIGGSLFAQETKLPVVDVTEADLLPSPPPPAPYEPPVEDTFAEPQVSVLAGGTVVLGTAAPTAVEPLARVLVDWSLAGEDRHLDAFVEADFTGLPDAEITFSDAAQFNALEMAMGLSYRPSTNVSASGYCEGGFASRLAEDTKEPKTSAPLWGSCGMLFRDRGVHRARLRIGIGPDERLGWGWTMAAHVKGSIRLAGIGGKLGVTLLLRAILGLETPVGQTQRVNMITAGIGMSFDN